MKKKMYEKPVAEVLRMDDTMQMICSSAHGFKSQTPIQIGKWGRNGRNGRGRNVNRN